MPIESFWRSYIPKKIKICPVCNGSGKDNDTLNHICWKCGGSGNIGIKRTKDLRYENVKGN